VLNQTVVGQGQIDLRTIANLYGGDYAGAVVDSVDVYLAHQDNGIGLELITDGQTADAKNSAVDFAELVPHFGAQLGNDLNSLVLQVDGDATVVKVVINLDLDASYYSTYNYGQDLILSQDVSVTVPDQGFLDLQDVIDLYNYQGYQVVSVSIVAQSTLSDFSVVRFYANDVEQDRALVGSAQAETRTFFIAGADELGNDLNDMKLQGDGGLVITHVEVRLQPEDPGLR
jgi:hypothetical protein